MIIIAHRANLDIPEPYKFQENSVDAVEKSIDYGFDAEIDIWKIKNHYYLGHDEPRNIITEDFLQWNCENLWLHAKNIEALYGLTNLFDNYMNIFWHEADRFTLTFSGYIWTFPGQPLTPHSAAICKTPEDIHAYNLEQLKSCYAICTDYPRYYSTKFQ